MITASPNSSPLKMKVILNNWLAKLLSLVLAVILWLVIHRTLAATVSPSDLRSEFEQRIRGDNKINFSTNGSPKK